MKVLLLVVDALRQDYLGCYGNSELNTGIVDSFASKGAQFDQAISSATWTPPSTSAIISGIFPHKLGIFDFDTPLNPTIKTVFHYLSRKNYEVGSFVFDENFLFSKFPFAKVQGNFRDFSKPLEWIRRNSQKDFFLYVHYYWVHGPYEPQTSAEGWSKGNREIIRKLSEDGDGVDRCREKYGRAVEMMSEVWLSQILKTLKDEEIMDETLVILTADHGESWGERIEDKSTIKVNFDLHGRFLYDELLKVPLIMYHPQLIPSNRIPHLVRNVDIMPTILDLCDVDFDRSIDGVSLVDMMNGDVDYGLHAISSSPVVEHNEITKAISKMSLRTSKWKLIWTIATDEIELYDLIQDASELNNIADRKVDLVKKLLAELKEEYEQTKTVPFTEKDRIKVNVNRLGKL